MNQQNTMAATAAANLVQDIATRLYGVAGVGVTDLIALNNLVQAEAAKQQVGEVQGDARSHRQLAIRSGWARG